MPRVREKEITRKTSEVAAQLPTGAQICRMESQTVENWQSNKTIAVLCTLCLVLCTVVTLERWQITKDKEQSTKFESEVVDEQTIRDTSDVLNHCLFDRATHLHYEHTSHVFFRLLAT